MNYTKHKKLLEAVLAKKPFLSVGQFARVLRELG